MVCAWNHLLFLCSGIHVDYLPTIPTLTTSYAHGTSSTSLLHTTIGESLLKTVERWPDREAVVFLEDGVRKTFAQLQQDVSLFLKVYCLCPVNVPTLNWCRSKKPQISILRKKYVNIHKISASKSISEFFLYKKPNNVKVGWDWTLESLQVTQKLQLYLQVLWMAQNFKRGFWKRRRPAYWFTNRIKWLEVFLCQSHSTNSRCTGITY